MQTLKYFKVHLQSESPLVMHCDKYCNPLHPEAQKLKKITSLRKKNDEHYISMSKLEWTGGLYYDEEIGIHIPSKCIRGALKAAARKSRKGSQINGIIIDCAIGTPIIGLEKHTPETLFEIRNKNGEQSHVFCEHVVVNKARILRTRPIFNKWEIKFDVILDSDLCDEKDMRDFFDTAGFECGIGELRPQRLTGTYGRFSVKEIKER